MNIMVKKYDNESSYINSRAKEVSGIAIERRTILSFHRDCRGKRRSRMLGTGNPTYSSISSSTPSVMVSSPLAFKTPSISSYSLSTSSATNSS